MGGEGAKAHPHRPPTTDYRLPASRALTRTATAKAVTATHRTFEVDGGVLRYRVAMAAVGVELTHHLSAELARQDEPAG